MKCVLISNFEPRTHFMGRPETRLQPIKRGAKLHCSRYSYLHDFYSNQQFTKVAHVRLISAFSSASASLLIFLLSLLLLLFLG